MRVARHATSGVRPHCSRSVGWLANMTKLLQTCDQTMNKTNGLRLLTYFFHFANI